MSESGIKVIMNISINGSEPVPFDLISQKQLAEARKSWGRCVGKIVSRHIVQHEADRKKLLGE